VLINPHLTKGKFAFDGLGIEWLANVVQLWYENDYRFGSLKKETVPEIEVE